MPNIAQSPKLKPAKAKAEDLGVSVRTLDRWAEAGILSAPIKIKQRKYWPSAEQPKSDNEA